MHSISDEKDQTLRQLSRVCEQEAQSCSKFGEQRWRQHGHPGDYFTPQRHSLLSDVEDRKKDLTGRKISIQKRKSSAIRIIIIIFQIFFMIIKSRLLLQSPR